MQGASTALPLHTSGTQILDSNNSPVYLRGVGVAGMTPDLIFWGTGGGDSWADQWQSASATSVTQTFQHLSTTWHVNMIRIFMYPEWYWLNGASGTANGENVQSYIATLASEAQQYGIYIDLVPYHFTAYSGSFTSDPYLSGSMTTNPGLAVQRMGQRRQQLHRQHRLKRAAVLDEFLDADGEQPQSLPERHL